ncbi:MAG: class I tRNA ligase family protein [Candidatus Moraniibacteriota bacterium]
MSKKLGNYPDPLHILDAYGADALRLYILSSPVVAAENLHFSEDDLASLTKNVFRMLWNSYSFFTVYAEIDGWKPKVETKLPENILDRWILAELQALTSEVTEAMEEYDIQRAARAFAPFIDNLSNWYIRRSRKRFWKNENDTDKEEAYGALYTVLVSLAKLMAPFTPFVSEEIYRNLTGEESVHLADWPKAEDSLADKTLSQDMYLVRERVTEALKLRSDRAVRVRQPLASVIVPEAFAAPLQQIFCEELNVKKVKKGEVLDFDWEITPN